MAAEFHFIADDFGRDASTNDAMVYSHRQGALTGVALMLGQQATDHAVALAGQNPELDIGWHFHVVDSQPLTVDQWPWQSPAQAGFAIGLSSKARVLVRAEVDAQWSAFAATGLPCAFINAHHHMFIHPFIRQCVISRLAGEFSGWMRWARPRFFGRPHLAYQLLDNVLQKPVRAKLPFRTSDTLWGIDRTFRMQAEEVSTSLKQLMEQGRENVLHEFMFHPRHIGDPDCRCLVALREHRRRV